MTEPGQPDFEPLFQPQVVAVAGMSTSRKTAANRFVQDLRAFGFAGSIYAIHPKADAVDGIRAYPSLGETPEPIDYAYIAVAAPQLPELLRAARGRVRFAQVMSSGFGELPGNEGKQLQADTLTAARDAGLRLLGPNCLGTYSPRGRMTFVSGAPKEAGSVGLISQSGGLAVDFIRRGSSRGLRFSGLVTVGNSADVDPAELLAYYLHDSDTRVIGMYLENCRRGRALFELLSEARGRKPVVLLKGGRSEQGSRAAASHTGALANDDRIWVSLCRQTGTALVETLDQFINTLAALQAHEIVPGHVTRNVALVGNGGGTSVLACDAFSRTGLGVPPLAAATVGELERLNLPPGTSLANPVDTPAGTIVVRDGELMSDVVTATAVDPTTDAVVAHFNLAVLVAMSDNTTVLLDNLCTSLRRAKDVLPRHKQLIVVLRSDGEPEVEQHRRRLVQTLSEARIPVVAELVDAAQVLGAIRGIQEAVARGVTPDGHTGPLPARA